MMSLEDTPTALPAGQQHLFGEPEFRPSLGQWHTPPWLCRRLVEWVPMGARILEPGCGSGNFIDALLRAGHKAHNITAVELDPAWVKHTRARFDNAVNVIQGDFLSIPLFLPFDIALGNFPFEDNTHMRFTLRALKLAPFVAGVFPAAFEFSIERDRDLWATEALAIRRARLPERVDYGGDQSPSFDSVALKLRRRSEPRAAQEISVVSEEVWRKAS